ncbi:MAG TPA: FKBP-type peptidyl-prolyl cis-trans isomerase [Vicinamibacterales bacterium]|jgi:FKBP-type peptidyl-prolyl cis-trans isomerase FkpA|nr:FKBP-type peptidyl-prolyl cis-trans isomerase [Vicinamibacterales bacterium]
MRTRFLFIAALLAFTACGSSDNSLAPTSVGVFTITDLTVGTGATAASGNRITVNYAGFLYDTSKTDGKGNGFDSNSSYQFTLGAGTVIAGWDQGIVGMKIGGRRRLIIPPALAYGSGTPDATKIPPNATLVFDVGLISIP